MIRYDLRDHQLKYLQTSIGPLTVICRPRQQLKLHQLGCVDKPEGPARALCYRLAGYAREVTISDSKMRLSNALGSSRLPKARTLGASNAWDRQIYHRKNSQQGYDDHTKGNKSRE